MADRIHIMVVTPEGVALDRAVNYVNLPTPEGSVGILADHAPMLCALRAGRLKCRAEEEECFVSVSGGVASVEDNALTVLTEKAEIEE